MTKIFALLCQPDSSVFNFMYLIDIINQAMLEDIFHDGLGLELVFAQHQSSLYFLTAEQTDSVLLQLELGGFGEWKKRFIDITTQVKKNLSVESARLSVFEECLSGYSRNQHLLVCA